MDQTLAQILSYLFQLQVQVQTLQAENARLKQVIDSKLPIEEGVVEFPKAPEKPA